MSRETLINVVDYLMDASTDLKIARETGAEFAADMALLKIQKATEILTDYTDQNIE